MSSNVESTAGGSLLAIANVAEAPAGKTSRNHQLHAAAGADPEAEKNPRTSERVVVLGATSGIARALCDVLAARGCRLVLAGRNLEELGRTAADLRIRHEVQTAVVPFEAADFEQHAEVVRQCCAQLGGGVDGVVFCCGFLDDQRKVERDLELTRRTIEINFTAAASILERFAEVLEQQQSGWIAAISSVAGDRGRQSNYTYGAAKAGLTAWLQGLRNRLYHSGVHVLTVKPGFVATEMTAGKLNPNSPNICTPLMKSGCTQNSRLSD